MLDISTLKPGDNVADKENEEYQIYGSPYLVDGVWHVEATWEEYAHVFKQGDDIRHIIPVWPIVAKFRRKISMENNEIQLDPAKIAKLRAYDPADDLKTEESCQNFLDDFKDDPEEIKVQAQQVVDRARKKHNIQ